MLRFSLLLLALTAGACVLGEPMTGATTSTTVAQQTTLKYSSPTCSGTPTVTATPTNTGSCTADFQGQYSATYCSAEGDFVYTVAFSDKACTVPISVSQASTKCNMANYESVTQCVNPSLGPQSPTGATFPPADWVVSRQYLDAAGNPADRCEESDTAALATAVAFRAGFCSPRGVSSGTSRNMTQSYFCSPDGAAFGLVAYADQSCSSVAIAQISPTSCLAGVQTTCPSGAATFPTLPTVGFGYWLNSGCGGRAAQYRLSSSACVDSQTTVCQTDTDGSKKVVVTKYSDTTKTGQCTGTATSSMFTADDCADASGAYQKFSCDITDPLGAATAASASFVAIAFAALVALLAARSQ